MAKETLKNSKIAKQLMKDKIFSTVSCGLAYRAKEDDLYLIWQEALLVEDKPEQMNAYQKIFAKIDELEKAENLL